MAFLSGTASNAADVLDRLVTFLTTDAGLVAANQHWQLLRRDRYGSDAKRDFVQLRGKGLANTDNIYINLTLVIDAASDSYYLSVSGAPGYSASVPVTTPESQPGSSIKLSGNYSANFNLPLLNAATPFWFVANGRRFIVVAKSGSYWGSAYAGLFLPYGSPSSYPYPLFVGANTQNGTRVGDTSSYVAASAFWRSYRNAGAIWQPGGAWLAFGADASDGGSYPASANTGRCWPWTSGKTRVATSGAFSIVSRRPGPDGSYALRPVILQDYPSVGGRNALLGEFDGVAATTGYGAAAGDTITAAGKTWLMVQRGSANGAGDFAAILLE